ncbi:hypothetical protein QTP70_009192 [Hemibagrus guttatus]|uniref:Reverse transcriptase domain-containing protein n=1 Tax=Hemibagrus guttatus TaxID=175788 RepID=A0AAE0RHU6_9TELE|nr:hypothetical protein QTP70_009192 [Hemibagrus guttatus]
MMFADDIVICSESREQLEENLERWRFALERRGMKVSRSKNEYMCVNEREGSGTVRLQGEEVKKVQEFKYLGSTVQSNGECGKEVKKRVQVGWNGWRKVSGVLCDRKISARIKGKVYKTVVRPAMLYGLETVSLRKRQESELEVAELKMLRFSLGVTRLDRIRNEYIRGTVHVGRLGDKVREARLRWFGHVQRREISVGHIHQSPWSLSKEDLKGGDAGGSHWGFSDGKEDIGTQSVRLGNHISSTLILNTSIPQGCVLSPLLYSLFTHDCVPCHNSNIFIKYADDTTDVGRISNNDESTYREEIQSLSAWCSMTNLTLNATKTKELIVDFRKSNSSRHSPIYINRSKVERVSSFKFLGVHISEDLSWHLNTSTLVRKAQQCLYFLGRFKKVHPSHKILTNFYRCIIESFLTSSMVKE